MVVANDGVDPAATEDLVVAALGVDRGSVKPVAAVADQGVAVIVADDLVVAVETDDAVVGAIGWVGEIENIVVVGAE